MTSFRADKKPAIKLKEFDEFLNLHSEGPSTNVSMTHNALLSGARLLARPLELKLGSYHRSIADRMTWL